MAKLQRYVSRELTHFLGRKRDDEGRYRLMLEVLLSGWFTHYPHNPNISGNLSVNSDSLISNNEMYNPQCICFCDIPLDDLSIHMEKYSPFGIAFEKSFLISKGANPVFYVAHNALINEAKDLPELSSALIEGSLDWDARRKEMDKRHELMDEYRKSPRVAVKMGDHFDRNVHLYHSMMELFDDLIMSNNSDPGVPKESALLMKLSHFLEFRLFSYVKSFDATMADDDPDNYYMEREWRIIGNFQFSLEDVHRIILPKAYASRFRADMPEYYGQIHYSDS
jgi:hypothetical protein